MKTGINKVIKGLCLRARQIRFVNRVVVSAVYLGSVVGLTWLGTKAFHNASFVLDMLKQPLIR